MNILEKIVLNTKKKLAQKKKEVFISDLENSPEYKKKRHSLKSALYKKKPHSIIAEIKFCSPSQGVLHSNIIPEKIAMGYQNSGAAAISVLTEEDYFLGKKEYLSLARAQVNIPILRKDFIIDEYQIVEARAIGADAILLIAASLSPNQIRAFTRLAHELELEVLLEVHSLEELENSFFDQVDIIGVNNRNLKSLQISLQTSMDLAKKIPAGYCKISESGLSLPSNVSELVAVGFDGFLIGESFMKTENPAAALKNFLQKL
jgi:indole-3-glycerol phosphate synthase